jgi:hypothetical protein
MLMGAMLVQIMAAQVDQENWRFQLNGSVWGPKQEFTPTTASLDSVQLWIPGPATFPPAVYMGGISAVYIRQGGVGGRVIAASEPVYTSPSFEGIVGYGFSQRVGLVPGQVYILEPRWLSGGGFFAFTYPGTYTWGRLLDIGEIDADLIFREGLGLDLVPEPSGTLLLATALALLARRTARETRKRWN